MLELSSLVLFTSDQAAASAFYRAVGVPLESEDHDGELHQAAEVGSVHVAIYGADGGLGDRARGLGAGGSDFPGFYVDSLDVLTAALISLDTPLLHSHETKPWGCRIIAEDPDGRAIEINQRGHCPS